MVDTFPHEWFIGIVSGICLLFTFIVRLMVKAALADFLRELNGTYVRESLYVERHREIERRVSILEHLVIKTPVA